MTVRVNKSAFNIREKLSELERPTGVKGNELMRAETAQDARDLAGITNGRKNILYNGDFKIAQRDTGTQSGTAATGYKTVDRWYIYNNAGGSNITHGRDSDVPDEGYSYSYKYEVTGAAPNSNSNYLMLRQYIEVLDVKHLAFGTPKAKSLTMSFWFKSNHSGTITWNQMIQNGSTQRQISRQVQIIGDGAWHKYVMTIPGDTNGGAIQSNAAGNAENYAGLYFDLIFWTETGWSSGSTLNTKWQNNDSTQRAVGHINMLTQLNDYIKITGIQLETGENATEFEHRSYGEELALCMRYYQKIVNSSTGTGRTFVMGAYSGTRAFGGYPLSVPMRVNPTVNHNNLRLETLNLGSSYPVTDAFTYVTMIGSNAQSMEFNVSSGLSANTAYYVAFSGTNSYLTFSAEI